MNTWFPRPDRRRGPERGGPVYSGPERRRRPPGLAGIDHLERRQLLSASRAEMAGAVILTPNPTAEVSGWIAPGHAPELFRITVADDSRLVAHVHASGPDTRLSLLDGDSNVLIQSEATSPTDPDDLVDQHVPPGDYLLSVEDRSGAGTYVLSAAVARASSPSHPLTGAEYAKHLASGDFNRDGIADLASANWFDGTEYVLLGLGDGTFRPAAKYVVGSGPNFLLACDLNRDGITDLATANQFSNDVSIMLGKGDGTFYGEVRVPAGRGPSSIAAGDFDGDGRTDLAVSCSIDDTVVILRNQGGGAFVKGAVIASADAPMGIEAADFDGDGHLDLAVAIAESNYVSILGGRGDGTFREAGRVVVGPGCRAVTVGDFDGDGRPDLAAVSSSNDTASVFLDRGGAFVPAATLATGALPYALKAADLDGDGHLDLVVCDYNSSEVSVFAGRGDGSFGTAPSVPVGAGPSCPVAADFNSDGRLDLATSDYIGSTISLLTGRGDATFQSSTVHSTRSAPGGVVEADLNGDGNLDLVVTNERNNEVEVLIGRGDGTFREPIRVAAGSGSTFMAVADFDGDHILDMAVANPIGNDVTLFKGRGDGTFLPTGNLRPGDSPSIIRAVDLDRDGRQDLVVTNFVSNDVVIYYGRGDGTFGDRVALPAGISPYMIDFGDFNGDGRLDLATDNTTSGDLTVYLATGRRQFGQPRSYPAGIAPWWIRAVDIDGDGRLDLLAPDYSSSPSVVAYLKGKGDGTFLPSTTIAVGDGPYPMEVADFNGDGRPDLVTGNDTSNDLTIRLGLGGGKFGALTHLAAGGEPTTIVSGDFNKDGRLDLVCSNFLTGDVTVYLGHGDGTFDPPRSLPIGTQDMPTVAADFDGDGRLDVALANPDNDTVTVRLGLGDGTFKEGFTCATGSRPAGLLSDDLNGDGRPDLVVSDSASDDVMVMLGLGDGTFQVSKYYAVGRSPHKIISGDFDRDGHRDIAVVDTGSDAISILHGRGDGTLGDEQRIAVGREPVDLVTADFDRNGLPDLLTINESSRDGTALIAMPGGQYAAIAYNHVPGSIPTAVTIADFNGDGNLDVASTDTAGGRLSVFMVDSQGIYSPGAVLATGRGPTALISADLDGDGIIDLAVADGESKDIMTFLGNGDGTFRDGAVVALDNRPGSLTLGDFNGDGHVDLAVADVTTGRVDVRLGTGDGNFLAPEITAPAPHPAPFVGDFNGDDAPDVAVVDRQGRLLVRMGRAGSPGEFGAPVVAPGSSALRDFVVVGTDSSPALVGLDRRESLILVSRKGPDRVRLSWSDPVPGGVLLSRVIAGDVDGDGLVDIVVLDRGSNSAHVMIQGADGHFRQVGRPIDVGFGPSDAILSDLDHDGKLDLVVTSSFSGIVSRFQGRGDGTFGPETRLRAGLDAAGLVSLHGGPARRSDDEPTAVVTGVFDASGLTDLVVVERVADRISILKGTPDGGLADPRLATSYATGRTPTRAVTTRLTRGPWADLAVLNEGSEDVSIFLNDGRGGFIVMPRVDAGDNPTGLLAEDVNKDGIPDLLVSNDSGDLLVLLGRGDGTFAPYQRADRLVSLAAGDLTGDGRAEFVLSDEAGDSLSVRSPDGPDTFQQGRGDGLRAPGPVAISDLDGDGIADLVVINRGGNNVFVYLGLGGGWFAAPRRFHTGTAPEGLTIADINGDKALDLVVSNAGSNDLTILLGQEAGGWDLHPGPRLRVGRQPVSTTIADVDGDGVSDIVCVDQASNDVTILHGVGGGFFDDRKATTLATGLTPIRAFVGRFDASGMGLVILNSRSNDLTFYPDIASGGGRKITIPTGGLNPVAGAMGFYNDDAYEDLVIAHNGDSKISLFHGGPAGLMLFDSIALEGSLRPTDLVLSPTADGLRVYVSTEDRGRVISITFTPGPTSSPAGSAIAEGPASTGISGDPRAWDGSTGATPGAPNSGPNGYGLQADGPQGATSPSSSQAGGTAGASAPGVGVSAIISQAAQALFLQSTTSLNWLIENLVNLGQVQRSEILPLDDNDTAMVAVLLSVSGIATSDDPAVDRAAPDGDDAPSPDGDGAGLPIAPESFVPASTVERYVSGLDRSFADLPRDASVPTSTQVTAGAEWVWSPQDARPAEFKAAESIVSSTQDSMPSADDGEAEASSDEGLEGLDRGLAEPGSSATEMEVPAEFGSATIMIGVIPIILTTVVLSVIHAARRVRAYRESKGLAGLAPPEASTQTRVRRTPGSSKGPAHRHQPNQDSPPWISGRST